MQISFMDGPQRPTDWRNADFDHGAPSLSLSLPWERPVEFPSLSPSLPPFHRSTVSSSYRVTQPAPPSLLANISEMCPPLSRNPTMCFRACQVLSCE